MDEREPRHEGTPAAATSGGAPALTNRLAQQTSLYLRSHAANPVQWYPWCPEALERARRETKPILLSIGYSACHWCHVMAHESFEDPATAAVMNELYVNIKVDREERPDLDRLYQLAQQLLTGRSGGWPLTMFLMHEDQRPFFGGTYFPREARFGLPSFRELLQQVAAYYHTHIDELRGNAERVVQALTSQMAVAGEPLCLTDEPLRRCRANLERSFDAQYGGFGAAPKFPHAPDLARLLRSWYASAHADVPDLQALNMSALTLTRMAEGGLFDQLGGGFFRYSVDERWEIPHFEKMLYDNAQLLALYAEAAAATGERLFSDTAKRTAEFVLRELTDSGGGFYSSLDADSEGHEGRFYVWRREPVQAALEPMQWQLFAAAYGLDGPPNFEGGWHLVVRTSAQALAERQHSSIETVRATLAAATRKLFDLRAERVRPALDDKVLTSWNALTIAALASASRYLDAPQLASAGSAALRALRSTHWQHGRLMAVSAAGRAQLPAYLDDHAFLIEAILELASVRFQASELAWAIELAELLLAHFEDTEHGGFYFTADDHETLISRPKSFSDDALPAGNAVTARCLLRLGHLLGEPRYLTAAERTVRAAWSALQQYPEAHACMLAALEDYLDPPRILLLRGPEDAIAAWRRELAGLFAPRWWTLAVPNDTVDLPEALAAKSAGDSAVGYICQGTHCSAAITSLPPLVEALLGHTAVEAQP